MNLAGERLELRIVADIRPIKLKTAFRCVAKNTQRVTAGVANDDAIDLGRRRDRAADEISERGFGELIPAVPGLPQQ